MHIEPEAKLIISAVLDGRDEDSIVIDIVNDDGNDTISLGVGKASDADYVVEVDGVSVITSPEVLDALEHIVFIADEQGKLAVVQMGCGCGCGCGGHDGESCGCGEHDHEGGCGCGGHDVEHGHSHEGGCGCGHQH